MKVMIDTCVSLDFIQQREPFFSDAEKIFEAISDEKIEGYLTVKSLADIHYVVKHIIHDEKEVRNVLRNLLTLLKLVDSGASGAMNALDSSVLDFEDALMIETSATENLDCIVTRNIKDYKKSSVQVVLPDQLLRLIK